jgi:methylmalonyl-CoA/ethylmalonyl-CoA epimerase
MPADTISSLRVNHVSIAVRDLNEAIDWYSSVLGLEPGRRTRFDAPGLNGENAFLERPGIRIELWALDAVEPIPDERRDPHSDLLRCGTKHVAFEVADLQSLLNHFVAARVDIAGVQREPRGPMRYEEHPEDSADPSRPPARGAFIRDPGGTLIEILQAAP